MGVCSPVCLTHAQEYDRAQRMKKSQKKRDARSMRSMRKMASLIATGFAHSEEQSDSRAAEVRRAIQTNTDEVRADVEKVSKATKEVLANVMLASSEAAEARLEAEEQRLADQMAKAKAKRVLFEEKQAREKAEKAAREATTEANNVALVAAIKEVGAAVEGEVSKVAEAITEVKKVVDNTNEAAVLAADAAVTGASASKDAKDALEAFKCGLAGTIEALLRKQRTMDDLISEEGRGGGLLDNEDTVTLAPLHAPAMTPLPATA